MKVDYLEMLKRARNNLPERRSDSRFETPRASSHTVGRMTTIRNFADIAKALRRNTSDIAKFLFRELGVPGELKGNELVLNGKINERLINQRLEEFVAEYVICKECRKPDTDMKKENDFFVLKCQACGARRSFKA
ncbi:MAG: translation initiation factor IF-2 subunit beta [Candidatus Aenigmarchaeota archaeon]|nr:translation initiation factor IF-2 subunit beta [Candidatus Aenigmarchaeota archaeon]